MVYIPLLSSNVSLASSFCVSSGNMGIAGSVAEPGERYMNLRTCRKALHCRHLPRSYHVQIRMPLSKGNATSPTYIINNKAKGGIFCPGGLIVKGQSNQLTDDIKVHKVLKY